MHKATTFAETFIVINIIGRFSVKIDVHRYKGKIPAH